MTRNGKIARLPREVREQLNRRLQDGEAGVRLVEWVNGLPDTQRVLATDFGGRDINEQNLSEWKNGGYVQWLGIRTCWPASRNWRSAPRNCRLPCRN